MAKETWRVEPGEKDLGTCRFRTVWRPKASITCTRPKYVRVPDGLAAESVHNPHVLLARPAYAGK